MSIRYGSSIRNEGGVVIKANYVYNHPNFGPLSEDNDVSILQLASDIEFGPNAQPIALADNEHSVDEKGVIAGWGAKVYTGDMSKQLQKTDVQVIESDICQSAYDKPITERMICATALGKDACKVYIFLFCYNNHL